MALRKIIIPVDSVLELFKSYTFASQDIPLDTVPVSLMVKPAEKGLFGIMTESREWKAGELPMHIEFDIRRVFGV